MPPRRATFHRVGPSIKATIFRTVFGRIVIAITIIALVVQVLRHPYLVANLYRLVGLAVAGVGHGSGGHTCLAIARLRCDAG